MHGTSTKAVGQDQRKPNAQRRPELPQRSEDSPPTLGSEEAAPLSIHEVKATNRDFAQLLTGSKLTEGASRLQRSASLGNYLTRRFSDCSEVVDRGRKLCTCGSWQAWLNFYTDGDVRMEAANFCQQPLLCAFCAFGRAVRQAKAAARKVEEALRIRPDLRPYLLTLTVRADPSLSDQRKNLLAAFAKIPKAARNVRLGKSSSVWGEFLGGILSCEAKRASGERSVDDEGRPLWHFHAHAVVLGREGLVGPAGVFHRVGEVNGRKGYAAGPMADAWSAAVGYQANSDLRPFRSSSDPEADLVKDLFEVCKYALKMNDLSFVDQWEAYTVLARQRLIRTWGMFYGLKLPEDSADDVSDCFNKPFARYWFRHLNGEFKLAKWNHGEQYQGRES